MNCKNCGTALTSENNFCNSCGAKVIHNQLTLKNVFEDFSEQFLNYDNKFLQTFIALFKKPEEVIGQYLTGTRKKYVNVLSYFAIAITISGLQLFIINKFFPEAMDISTITTENAKEMSKNNLDFVNQYQSIIMMLYVPIYALLAQLVFLKVKRYNYTEHLVMFMYILSQISIVGAIIQLSSAIFDVTLGTTSLIVLPLQVIYSAYCLKRLYKLSLKGIVLRTLLFLSILILFLIIVSIITVLSLILYHGGMKEFMESQKPTAYLVSSAINWTS